MCSAEFLQPKTTEIVNIGDQLVKGFQNIQQAPTAYDIYDCHTLVTLVTPKALPLLLMVVDKATTPGEALSSWS